MSEQSFELNDFDNLRKQEEDEVNEEETEFGGGSDESDLLDDNLDWLSSKGKNNIKTRLDNVFGTRKNETNVLVLFLKELPLETEKGYKDLRFIKYLMDTQDFTIKKMVFLVLCQTMNYHFMVSPFLMKMILEFVQLENSRQLMVSFKIQMN